MPSFDFTTNPSLHLSIPPLTSWRQNWRRKKWKKAENWVATKCLSLNIGKIISNGIMQIMSITKHNYVNKRAVPKRQKNTHTKVNNIMAPQIAWRCIFQMPSLRFKTNPSIHQFWLEIWSEENINTVGLNYSMAQHELLLFKGCLHDSLAPAACHL